MYDYEPVVVRVEPCGTTIAPFDAVGSVKEALTVEVAHVEPWVILEEGAPVQSSIQSPHPLVERRMDLALAAHAMRPWDDKGERPKPLPPLKSVHVRVHVDVL